MPIDFFRHTKSISIAVASHPTSIDDVKRPFNDPSTSTRAVRRVTDWVQVCREFSACHRRPLNVAFHCLTTPLSIFGLFSALNQAWPMSWAIATIAYVLVICRMIPLRTLLATMTVVLGLGVSSWLMPVGLIAGVGLFVAGYIAQEMSHWLTGEPTLQSTYTHGSPTNWIRDFVRHTVLLLPLILVTAGRRRQSPLRLLVTRKAVLPIKLSRDRQIGDLQTIRKWVRREHPSLIQSTHWWQYDLDGDAKDAFDRLSDDPDIRSVIRRHHGTGYRVRPVLGMNELYVTGPPKSASSDTVFYMAHVDGPWSVYPGARVYRCMLAASANAEVTTHFPMVGKKYTQPEGYRLETGAAVAFDFNRELHYISRVSSPTQTEPRINLKLHFIAYPKALPRYGALLDYLTTRYDVTARNLFLQTIEPNSRWTKIKTYWVLCWTKAFELISRFAGWSNLAYVSAVGFVALALQDWRIFAAGTSFVHYMIYAAVLREQTPVAFGDFKRNAVFYKSIAVATLFLLYVLNGIESIASVTLVVLGFSLATLASRALGLDRTYFSVELGLDPPQRVAQFPYGWLPHPMIVGSMVGIGGTLLSEPFRIHAAWLAIGHLLAYAAILTQEILVPTDRAIRVADGLEVRRTLKRDVDKNTSR